jgi:hypothetical protein
MGGFFEAAFGFPAVIFTVLLAPVVVYWLTVVLGMFDVELLGDLGAPNASAVDAPTVEGATVEAGGAGEAGADGSGGALDGWWQALGLTGVPVTIAASLVVLFGWLVALVATAAVDSLELGTAVRLVAGVAVLVTAVVAGALAASVVARPLGRLFASTSAEARVAFVGRTCTVRTAEVTPTFGQAEAADPSGATVLVPVRTVPTPDDGEPASPLRLGDRALIFEYDPVAEVFLVCPVDDALGAGAEGPP